LPRLEPSEVVPSESYSCTPAHSPRPAASATRSAAGRERQRRDLLRFRQTRPAGSTAGRGRRGCALAKTWRILHTSRSRGIGSYRWGRLSAKTPATLQRFGSPKLESPRQLASAHCSCKRLHLLRPCLRMDAWQQKMLPIR